MTMQVTKRKIGALICALLILALTFCGCDIDIKEDVKTQKQLCEKMIDRVIENDAEGAYALVSDVGTKEEFLPVWEEMRGALKESKSYEIKATGWKTNINNGNEITQVTLEVTTDDGKTCQFTVTTLGDGSVAGLHFLDSTDFIESTSYVPAVKIVLMLISLAFAAFSVWMFVDAIRRRMKRKVWWVLLTLVHAGITLVTGPSQFNIKFNVKLVFGLSDVAVYNSSLAVAIGIFIPVGAIIYFFMRKKLSAKYKAQEQTEETENAQETAQTVGTPNEEVQNSVYDYAINPAEKTQQEEKEEDNNNNNNTQQGE